MIFFLISSSIFLFVEIKSAKIPAIKNNIETVSSRPPKNNLGIIAQDVLDIIPETINTYKTKLNESDPEETELYNFDSHALTFALINAVKELNQKIQTLENKKNG